MVSGSSFSRTMEGTGASSAADSELCTRGVVESFLSEKNLPRKKLRTNGNFENRLEWPENKNLRKRVWVRG